METCLPNRPVIGFRNLSDLTGVPASTLRCALHDGRLPLRRYQAGVQAAFHFEEVTAWLLDGLSLQRPPLAFLLPNEVAA